MAFSLNVGSVQVALLMVELILLGTTLFVIVITRREFRARGEMMRHASSATDAISRQEYFATLIDAIQSAESYVYSTVTATNPSPEESDTVAIILDSVSKASIRDVNVRYLVPQSPDRLQMARRYKAAGADMRFHPDLIVSDARFTIVDDITVIIGVPNRSGKDLPTKKGHAITSESIAYLFRERFEKQWNLDEAKSYSQYLLELVTKARETNPHVSSQVIASNLKINKEDIEYVDAIVKDSIIHHS